MNELSPLAVIMVMAIAAVLMGFAALRDERRVLLRRFGAAAEPGGPATACEVRFGSQEAATPCIVRPTRDGWYMVSPQEAVAKRHWTSGVPFLRKPVLIPWALLEYRPARFPFHKWLRFDVPSAKVTFFVRQNVALDLLRAANRPLPSA